VEDKREKPLFIWERLTGKLFYESNDTKTNWYELQIATQELFERAAKTLNAQLSLCWLCGERAQLTQPHLLCEPCQKNGRVLTLAEYQKIVNEQDCDYCDCCGDTTKIEFLVESQMPLERPETQNGQTFYPLMGGKFACYPCTNHCEDGPCNPENLKVIVEDVPGQPLQERIEDAQRRADYRLPTDPSKFSMPERAEE